MEELDRLITQLQGVREVLRRQMIGTTDVQESNRLYNLLLKINYQIQALNSLMFSMGTEQLTAAHLGAIHDATEEVGAAIAEIDQLSNVIGAVADVLGIAQGVIDLFH